MTDKDTTAPADDKPVRKPKIGKATLQTVPHATGSNPAMLIDGDAPTKGSKFTATLDNGINYAGIVSDTQDQGGKTLVTFRDGIEAVT